MGFVKTREELDRYYRLGVRTFWDATMMGVLFNAEPDRIAPLLPLPLEQADDPGGLIFIAEYPKTNLGPGYREAALFLRCKYRGEVGSTCLSMPVTNEARMHNGRDVFGFPKKLAVIYLERAGGRVLGWVEREGVRFVEIEADLQAEIPGLPQTGPTFLFKAMPRIDLTPGFDGPVLLASQKTEIRAKRVEVGSGRLTLRPSEFDPWVDIGDVKVTAAFHLTGDVTMLPGRILAEVDPETFLPHYFKMTDFYAGD